MQAVDRHRLGGQLLAVGAGLSLAVKMFWLGEPSPIAFPYKVITYVFDIWLARLIMPVSVEEGAYYLEFTPTDLLWVPLAAVVLLFLLWSAVKIIKGQFNRVSYPVISILGLWLAVGLVYGRFSAGFEYFEIPPRWALVGLLSDLASLSMIIGIAIVFVTHKQVKGVTADYQYSKRAMAFFAFEGRINRAKFWLYSLLLTPIWLIGLMIDLSTTGEFGGYYWMGVLICLWPTLALNVKRCHDRDKSGWFYLVAFIPIVNLWYLVEVGFLKGTEGDNRYGPNPLGQT